MKHNVLNLIDAYKIDHRRQYPEGTTRVYSNFTPRGSRIENVDKVVNFGLQAALDTLYDLFEDFFESDIDDVCNEYENNITAIVGPNDVGSEHIRALHTLGYLPLEFKSLPEGYQVPLKVPMFTVENTHDDFFWLVNYLESILSALIWLPSTSATQAKHLRDLLETWARRTGSAPESIDFQGHDFSFRGMDSIDSAAASGAGHLLSFLGSDSLPAKDWLKYHYSAEEPVLLSVPATEHSVMCAGGADDERGTFERLLRLYPSGIVSVVSDTWDLWNTITNILPSLKDEIMARDGKLVIRPDSGNPVDILCGVQTVVKKEDGSVRTTQDRSTPEGKGVIELLWDIFGGTINEKGFKVLDPHIGAIYGDSITYDRAREILHRLHDKGFASENIVLGVGSFTYTYVTRDTFGFAMKATWVKINGEEKAIFKDPVTDSGEKKSATGRMVVVRGEDGELKLIDNLTLEQQAEYDDVNLLRTTFKDGLFERRNTAASVKTLLTAGS